MITKRTEIWGGPLQEGDIRVGAQRLLSCQSARRDGGLNTTKRVRRDLIVARIWPAENDLVQGRRVRKTILEQKHPTARPDRTTVG